MMKSQTQSSSFAHNPGDLVFVKREEEGRPPKPVLIRVSKVVGRNLIGVMEVERHRNASTVEVPASSVMMNLGSDPLPGHVYGYDLSYIYRRSVEVPYIGDVGLFCKVKKEEYESFCNGVVELRKKLKSVGLAKLLDEQIDYEVVSKSYAGKWAGMYSCAKAEGSVPKIQITLDTGRLQESSLALYSYVLAHEIGHHVHFKYVKPHSGIDARWVSAYQRTVRPAVVPETEVSELLKKLLQHRSVSGLKSDLEEERLPRLQKVLKEVRSSSGLSTREIDLLLSSDEDEQVRSAWLGSGVSLSTKHPSVSEYALKNYKELFAESFAFYVLGHTLPKSVSKLIDASLQTID